MSLNKSRPNQDHRNEPQPDIILASSSPYRRSLLEKLQLPFRYISPDINESAQDNEAASQLVERLARAKAKAIAIHHPNSWIIGSDQVALLKGTILGKPHTQTRACAQLQEASGERVTFYTGLCLFKHDKYGQEVCLTSVETFSVNFRTLTDIQISNYVSKEQPLDCAGSFKAEGLGIALFDKLEGDDPNTLIGLPLIALVKMLTQVGIEVL